MSIAATVNATINRIPPGRIFGYEVFPEYREAPQAVMRAVGRRVEDGYGLKRLTKGRFYRPRWDAVGEAPVSNAELLRDVLYRDGRRIGYVTGPALYNRLKLTTQVPEVIAVASNRAAQIKNFGTIRIKIVPRRAPINKSTIPLLEILDVLRDAKKIHGASVKAVLDLVADRVAELAPPAQRKLQRLALDYYGAGARALLREILAWNEQQVLPVLSTSINPTTRFHFGADHNPWPDARQWNIPTTCTENAGDGTPLADPLVPQVGPLDVQG